MDLEVFCVHQKSPKIEDLCVPMHCSCKNSKCNSPGRASLPAGCRVMDLLEDARGNSFLILNLDNTKVKNFALLLVHQAPASLPPAGKAFG